MITFGLCGKSAEAPVPSVNPPIARKPIQDIQEESPPKPLSKYDQVNIKYE